MEMNKKNLLTSQENHLIKSTFLANTQSPVSGFCCAQSGVCGAVYRLLLYWCINANSLDKEGLFCEGQARWCIPSPKGGVKTSVVCNKLIRLRIN